MVGAPASQVILCNYDSAFNRMISACVPEIGTLYLGIHFMILLYTNAEFSNVLCAYFFYKCLWPWNLPNYIYPIELEI